MLIIVAEGDDVILQAQSKRKSLCQLLGVDANVILLG